VLRLLTISAVIVFLFNIPFGYWRSHTRKFSLQWLLAIHVPVPFIICVRLLLGLGWRPITFPVLIGAFFIGQFVGTKIQRFFI
jgi:hypothetical protein